MRYRAVTNCHCGTDTHRLAFTKKGQLVTLDHDEYAWRNVELMGGEVPHCIKAKRTLLADLRAVTTPGWLSDSPLDEFSAYIRQQFNLKHDRVFSQVRCLYEHYAYTHTTTKERWRSIMHMAVCESLTRCTYQWPIDRSKVTVLVEFCNSEDWVIRGRPGQTGNNDFLQVTIVVPTRWYQNVYLPGYSVYEGNLVLDVSTYTMQDKWSKVFAAAQLELHDGRFEIHTLFADYDKFQARCHNSINRATQRRRVLT